MCRVHDPYSYTIFNTVFKAAFGLPKITTDSIQTKGNKSVTGETFPCIAMQKHTQIHKLYVN